MHHLDRTLHEFEAPAGLGQEFAGYPAQGEYAADYSHEAYELEGEFEDELEGEDEQTLGELSEELQAVGNELELNQFLGNLLSQAAGPASRLLASAAGQSVGRYLAGLGQQVLPQLARHAAGPLAAGASRVFGLELEMRSPESQELEISRAYVRFAADVARRAAAALHQQPGLAPGPLGRLVLGAAAPLYAPGLLGRPARRPRSGTWERRGRRLVLYGV